MIVAELLLTEGGFGDKGFVHVIRFADLERAKSKFAEIEDIFKRKEERKNDVPKMLEVIGDGNQVTLPLDHLRSVGLCDYARANTELAGVRDTFPNMFKI